MIQLYPLAHESLRWANRVVTDLHYLHTPPDVRTMPEGYMIYLDAFNQPVGLLMFGRPEATRCADWYGGLDDLRAGRCQVTRWQVLNLSRVLILPEFQPGGWCYGPDLLPGFIDRRGAFRSTLASAAIRLAIKQIGVYYLLRRPPVFVDEPYEIEWLLSYCDTRFHRGVIYRESGFELYRTNENGIQTWRTRLPSLTMAQTSQIWMASRTNRRAIEHRSRRAQLKFEL